MSQDSFSLLRSLNWLSPSQATLTPPLLDWLMEEHSMTRRFERHCQRVTVQPLHEGFINASELGEESALLPDDERFWLREVLLFGDDQPWLAGRMLAPESTLTGPEAMLQQLGTQPLGRYLFSSSTLTRDFIESAQVEGLWGRRSLLRLSGKPLLLTELFLPASPLYRDLV